MKFKIVHFLLLSSFFFALSSGLFVGAHFIAQNLSIVEDSSSVENAGYFFFYVLFATALMLLVLHFYKGRRLFFAAEILLEFTALQLLFSLFIPALHAGVLALVLVLLRILKSVFKQPLLFSATVVVGALLGSSFDLVPALILGFLLAGYDYFAVFKSKHMITLAKELQKREAAFAIEFTAPLSTQTQTRLSSYSTKPRKQGLKRSAESESILLGTGDFAIPVMISVSLLKVSVFSALMAALGAFVGLSVLLFVMQKTRGYYPALPPLVFFSTLFYAVSLLF